ncbi:hypothetical protein HCH_06386 [Hahella chejuensis KCTC 2396]|uniref:Uncharacterized protein n=1 Tax=Hahella chejuensis (strain KCTC 2396) TaxID=349521 RepID=Q2S8J3_HAHCH|nr:hypothetical protein [Hahella chejuensis]ABC33031.1 hypothetical protein HCH_06386 [Hahella chejuensis KCTC 2396]
MDVFSDVKFIAALVSLVGILLAAVISSAGYFYKNWTESKRSARKVLYFLLEIRYAVNMSIFNPNATAEKFLLHYFKRVEERGLPFDSEDIKVSVLPLIIQSLTDISNSLKIDIEERLVTPLDDALLELATVNPVLAYQLRGKDKFETLASHVFRYTDSIRNNLSVDVLCENTIDMIVKEAGVVSSGTISKLVSDLELDILALAKYCGRRDYRSAKDCIDLGFSATNDIDLSKYDEMIDEILDRLLEEYAKQEFIRI